MERATARARLEELYGTGDWARLLIKVAGADTKGPRPGKRPLGNDYGPKAEERYSLREDADRHLDSIAAHIASGGNVGLVVPAGVFVFDADNSAAVNWCVENLPFGPRQNTAKGAHFWLSAPSEELREHGVVEKPNVEIAPGVRIDIRAVSVGTQQVVAPSKHPEAGDVYEWIVRLPLEGVIGLPPLPQDVLQAVYRAFREGASRGSAGPGAASDPAPGERADASTKLTDGRRTEIVRVVARLRNMFTSEEQLEKAALAWVNDNCADPERYTDYTIGAVKRYMKKEGGRKLTKKEREQADAESMDIEEAPILKKPVPIEWLQGPFLPRGRFCLLMGSGGLGKSTFTIQMGCRLSRGLDPIPTPDENLGLERREPKRFVYITTEDTSPDVISGRIAAFDGNADYIHVYDMMSVAKAKGFNVTHPIMRKILEKHKPDLCILDPLSGVMPPRKHNEDQGSWVRETLTEFTEMITTVSPHTCVVGIMHMRKDQTGDSSAWGLGSVEYVNVARSVIQVFRNVRANEEEREETDELNERVLVHMKTNLGPMSYGIQYKLNGIGWDPLIWDKDAVHWNVTAFGIGKKKRKRGQPSKINERMSAFMAAFEEAGGKLSNEEIAVVAKNLGMSDSVLEKFMKSHKDRFKSVRLPGADGNMSVFGRELVKDF